MTGIVIVTWNSEDVIGQCLDACLKFTGVKVLVVDNASADDTVGVAMSRRGVNVIANTQNLGFAAACNQGIRVLAACDTVLLLNPDCEVDSGIEALAEAARKPGAGASTGRLLNPDGTVQRGFNIRRFPTAGTLAFEVLGLNRLFPSNPLNRRWRMLDAEPEPSVPVEQPAGAFLMLRREAWAAIGGLDERFWPAWFEDVDLCLRLKHAGYAISFVPDAAARHIGGHSASRLEWADLQLFWYDNLLRFAEKHFSAVGRRTVAAAVMLASIPRSVAGAVSGHRLSALAVYSKVIRAACNAWRGRSQEENRARQ